MSSGPKKPTETPSVETKNKTINSNEFVAADYVAHELVGARTTLNWTRAISLVLVVGALVETIFVAGGLYSNLQPRTAAVVADGIIAQRVDDNSDNIKSTIEEKIPLLIAQVPDQTIQELPVYRQTLENDFQTSLTSYATDSSKELDAQLTDYLAAHKDEVGAALSSGQDPAVVHALAEGLTADFVSTLQETQDANGETAQEKIDKSLTNLIEVKEKLDHLASNKNLTPEEHRTRRAIAILAQTVGKQAAPLNISQQIADAQTGAPTL